MKKINVKKLVVTNLPYGFIALLFTKLGQAVRLSPGNDIASKLSGILDGLDMASQSALPSFHPFDLLIGIAIAAIIRLIVYVKGKNAKKFRKNEEYGSARWGKHEDIEPYIDPAFENNIILTQTELLTMNNRPRIPRRQGTRMFLSSAAQVRVRHAFGLNPISCNASLKSIPVHSLLQTRRERF